jgi:hypothetical protein
MRKIMLAITPIVASAALLLTAGTAFAADPPPVNTGTTFTITGGALTISAPAGPVNLATGAASVAAQAISGTLGNVAVSDARGVSLGWTTTAMSTAFANSGLTVPASAITYLLATPTTTGWVTVTGVLASDLTTAKTVETATLALGVNTATWNPTISILVPAGTQTGVYAATMTHSVI